MIRMLIAICVARVYNKVKRSACAGRRNSNDTRNDGRDTSWCFGCGKENPIGLKLDMKEIDGVWTAYFMPKKEHESYGDRMHGRADEHLARRVWVTACSARPVSLLIRRSWKSASAAPYASAKRSSRGLDYVAPGPAGHGRRARRPRRRLCRC